MANVPIHIWRAPAWRSFCADEVSLNLAKDGDFEQVKKGDLIYADGEWKYICSEPASLYAGVVDIFTLNPTINDSNTNTVYPGSTNISMRLWFATANFYQTSGVGTGPDIGLPFTFDLRVSGRSGGSVNVSSVNFDIYSSSNFSGEIATNPSWVGSRTLSAEINSGVKQASISLAISLPSMGDTFELDIRHNNPSGEFQILPLRSSGGYTYGIDVSLNSLVNGSWMIQKF